MARATITPAVAAPAGIDIAAFPVDTVNGHQFPWSRNRVLICLNRSASPTTVTVDTPDTGVVTSDGLPVTTGQRTVVVPANSCVVIDTRAKVYRQSTGFVNVDVTPGTTVFLGTLEIGNFAD